jgi:hypothetical protein
MRYVWRIVYPVLLLTASALLALFYPMLLLVLYAGAFVLLMLSRQLNLYRIVMLLKRVARKLGALRAEIRTRIGLGLRDYSSGVSGDVDEELHHRSHGYIR